MPSQKLSARTRKQIDALPEGGQRIFKRVHANALKQYKSPSKRRKSSDSPEAVAHKVAWNAVRKKYKKKGSKWVSKENKN